MRIKAFKALYPSSDIAHLVASPPYDTVDTDEARLIAEANPWSFLRIVRSEIDLPTGTDLYSNQVYDRAAENFESFIREQVLVRDTQDSVYVYSQTMGHHTQTGVVACCHVEDYENKLIKRHEKTRKDKEEDRLRHILTLNAHTGPVFLTYRRNEAVDKMVDEIRSGSPLLDVIAPDGVGHTIWRAPRPDELVSAFGGIEVMYIADGHHRAAASARAGAEKRSLNSNHTGREEYNWFLSVMFPSNQLKILPYNRCVSDLNGMTESEFLEKVRGRFDVRDNADPVPQCGRQASMYLGGDWYGLSWKPVSSADPVEALDVSVLQNRLLGPILGVEDPCTDERIRFIGGIKGYSALSSAVDSKKASVAFSMFSVTVEEMMAIADAGQTMPPKSTWFEPKLRSGLLVHTF
ncbi:MAG: DUF1015 domain-containing protein [Lentisphaerae bacterium]|nr:DUF1015 domain-containing protein [Lentisphaerota bacterium]